MDRPLKAVVVILVLAFATPAAAQECRCVCPMLPAPTVVTPPTTTNEWLVLGGGAVALVAGVVLSVVSLAVVAETKVEISVGIGSP